MAAFAVYGPGSERSVAVKGFGRPEACETIHVSGRQFSVIPPRKLLVGFLPTAASEIISDPHPCRTLSVGHPGRGSTTMGHSSFDPATNARRAWNAGRSVGAKRTLKRSQVWAIRFWLDRESRLRDRALFDLAIDRKLRGCDVVKVKIGDLVSGGRVRARAVVVQRKTKRPVQFELLEAARGYDRRVCLPESH